MASHDPAKTPQEIFDESPAVIAFLAAVEAQLAAGKREIDAPADYPKDFCERTVEHFKNAGWETSYRSTTKKFTFVDNGGGGGFFGKLFG